MKEHKSVHWYERLDDKEEKPKAKVSSQILKTGRKYVGFEKHIEESYRWIHQVAVGLGNGERFDIAYQALKTVLYVLRDRMTPDEVFQLSAQLPIHIRGIFFEGYNLKDKPQKIHKPEFLKRISEDVPQDTHDPKHIFKVVLQLLYSHITIGELKDIYAALPKDLQALWDEVVPGIPSS